MSKKYLVTQDQTVDGMPLEDSAVIHYTTCSTAAATTAKTAALSGFKLVTGAWAAVKFTVTNTAANPTLDINGTGAKEVRYRNAAVNADVLAANRVYLMVYDGTYWQVVGDLDTTYTHPTTAGNKHVPTGGSSNQILVYSASGTAKWSGTCNAAAMDVVTGTWTSSSGNTIAYKTGRSKAIIIVWVGFSAYGIALVNSMDTMMSPIEIYNNGSNRVAQYIVNSGGNIQLIGTGGSYMVIWFN